MRDTSLLQLALGWCRHGRSSAASSTPRRVELDIHIDFAAGSRFACPCCGAADCPAYDTEQMSWRHLDFFQHQAFLYARVPRVHCTRCGIKTLSVPWARPDSGFTLLFEALVMSLVQRCWSTLWPVWSANMTPGRGASFTITSIVPGQG